MITTNTLFQNGTTWLRADFHLHTKADKDSVYSGDENDFVNAYIDKLVEQDIRVGIITNHNRFDKGEFVALKKNAKEKGIGLFPGVKFSLKEGIHILIVFDDAWYKEDTDNINDFLPTAFYGVPNYDMPPYPNSNYDLDTVVEKLDNTGHNYLIIPKEIEEAREETYIKIGDFNFEALQYALLDHKNRIRKDKPQIRNSYIKSITFEGGILQEKNIHFSPELNSLIGIRGSGKSSILEILRYTLDIPFGSQAVDKEYKDNLIKHVLQSGGIAIVEIVDRLGNVYKAKRIYGHKESVYKNGILQQDITLDAILRQPIYFGQKDLSSKDADFENDLVNKLIGHRLNNIQTEIEKENAKILQIINELNRFSNLSLLKKETETAKANAEHKLNLFKEKGIAEKLQLQISFESDSNHLQNYKASIYAYLNDIKEITQNHVYSLNKELESKTNPEIFEEAKCLVDKLRATLRQIHSISTDVQKTESEFSIVIDKLKTKKEELKEEFARIKREIDIPDLNPDDFIKISREHEISKLKLIEIDNSENKRVEQKQLLNEAVDRLDALWYDKFILLKDEVDKINRVGNKLSIEVDYKGRKDKFQSKLKDVFKGSRISDTTYNTISDDYADFINMWKDNFRKLSDRLTENQLIEVKNRFQTNLYDLLTYEVPNKIIINFDNKPLIKHSLGQRASALILFLLSQKENDILIIDQPEDDLDNQTIYQDVIHEIKKLKGEMQFIFATHNANIPVLGDSEILIACEYIDGKEIKLEKGSIDHQPVQEKVINIMEGGKEAFNIRQNIYKIWEVTNL